MHNVFGTDGIRGRVGTGFFTHEQLLQLGVAIAQWAQEKYATATPRVLLVHDTRISASFVKAALKTGLLQQGVIIEDAGVLPTPACAHLMQVRPEIHCSIIVSASHNPYEDNGIKIMDRRTGKLTVEDEQTISRVCAQQQTVVPSYGTDIPWLEAQTMYCDKLTSLFPDNFLAGKKIVLDTAHGATYQVAPCVFKQLGAEVIVINDQPTGYNINQRCGALHTEQLSSAVVQHQADAGFAFDGDGDRVIGVNRFGHVKDGDDLLALLAEHVAYLHSPAIVGTSMSNEGFAQQLKEHKKLLVRTAVGDKYVAEQLMANQWLLGGEPSGHIILHDIIPTGDGILAALRVLEAMQQSGNSAMETFTHYPQVMINLPVAVRKDLSSSPLATIIKQAQENLQTGRVLVRYSGTENVLRIMVETDTAQKAQTLCTHLVEEISQLF